MNSFEHIFGRIVDLNDMKGTKFPVPVVYGKGTKDAVGAYRTKKHNNFARPMVDNKKFFWRMLSYVFFYLHKKCYERFEKMNFGRPGLIKHPIFDNIKGE